MYVQYFAIFIDITQEFVSFIFHFTELLLLINLLLLTYLYQATIKTINLTFQFMVIFIYL